MGAMRIAAPPWRACIYVLHAPQGDTYADLLFTMIERRAKASAGEHIRHFRHAILAATPRIAFQDGRARCGMSGSSHEALLVGASCTAELIQDDPGGLARALNLPVPVVAA